MNRLEWAKLIKERDNYICVQCGSNENIEAHHILPQNEAPELIYDLSNGITLCKHCHLNIHAKKRRKRDKKEVNVMDTTDKHGSP